MSEDKMDVSFIIVNYKTKELTAKAISSIYKFAQNIKFEIILVDNNSQDKSVNYLKKKFPKIRLIENTGNFGFGKANNQGMEIANGEFLFLFNSDAYLIDDSISKIIQRAKEINNLGAISPLILNVDKSIQQSGGFSPSLTKVFWWMSFLDDLPFGLVFKPYHIDHDSFYKKENELDWLTGAAMIIPKSVYNKVGGFDENIFMYGEDIELCNNIKKAGFKIVFSPAGRLIHLGQGSSKKVSKNAILGEYSGLVYFYKKNRSRFSLQILKILLKMGALLRVIVFGLLGMVRQQADRKELSKIYAEAFKVA